MKKLIIGVDFDGTLVTENFPEIGILKQETVEFCKRASELGHTIIIWTARSGKAAIEACDFLIENAVPFDFFNEFPDCEWAKRGEQGRKIFCDIYLDDRAININYLFQARALIEDPLLKPVDKLYATALEDIYYLGTLIAHSGTSVEILRIIGENVVIFNEDTYRSASTRKQSLDLPPGLV